MYNVKISGNKTPLEGFRDTYVSVQKEEMKPGETEYVHRIVLAGKSSYKNVGWVVDGDCAACMKCHSGFGMTLWKHHCRACGDCVCAGCSTHRIDLVGECGLKESGGSRVCGDCHTDMHFRMAKMFAGEAQEVTAINPAYQEAPTPSILKHNMPKSILKHTQSSSNGKNINKNNSSPSEGGVVSPVTAMLNNLNGRWDRSDDGISTPGTITTDAGDSIKTTPDTGSTSSTAAAKGIRYVKTTATAPGTAQTTATDKYFFTPNSAFGSADSKSSKSSKGKGGRQVLGDVDLENITPNSANAHRDGKSNKSGKHISSKKSSSKKNLSARSSSRNNKNELNNENGSNQGFSPLPDTPGTSVSSASPGSGGGSSKRFVPVPSFVIKGSVDNWQGNLGESKSIYINVCKHGSLPMPGATELRSGTDGLSAAYVVGELREMDRDGERALAIDVCYHNQVHVWAYADENGQNLSALAEHAVVCVNATHKLHMYIASLPQWTTYYGNVKALELKVSRRLPEMAV